MVYIHPTSTDLCAVGPFINKIKWSPVRKSSYIYHKMWEGITYPFQTSTVHLMMNIITYPCVYITGSVRRRIPVVMGGSQWYPPLGNQLFAMFFSALADFIDAVPPYWPFIHQPANQVAPSFKHLADIAGTTVYQYQATG